MFYGKKEGTSTPKKLIKKLGEIGRNYYLPYGKKEIHGKKALIRRYATFRCRQLGVVYFVLGRY